MIGPPICTCRCGTHQARLASVKLTVNMEKTHFSILVLRQPGQSTPPWLKRLVAWLGDPREQDQIAHRRRGFASVAILFKFDASGLGANRRHGSVHTKWYPMENCPRPFSRQSRDVQRIEVSSSPPNDGPNAAQMFLQMLTVARMRCQPL